MTLRWPGSQPGTEDSQSSKPSLATLLFDAEADEQRFRTEYIGNDSFPGPENWSSFLKSTSVDTKAFTNKAKFLQSFNWQNVVLAGGSISRLLKGNITGSYDYDFYIYGLPREKALIRLAQLLAYFVNYALKNELHVYPKIIRSRTAITIAWGLKEIQTVQICLTLARDPLEVLLSFDIAPAKVCYDGKKVYMTKTAAIAYSSDNYLISESTLEAAGVSLMTRINKYGKRGFNPIPLDSTYEKIIEEAKNAPVKLDPHYTVIDPDELKNDGTECVMARTYQKNPTFIVMRLRANYTIFPLPNIHWDVNSLDVAWKYLNSASEWWQAVQHEPVEYPDYDPGYKNPWAKCPRPDLPEKIEFLSVKELFVLIKK